MASCVDSTHISFLYRQVQVRKSVSRGRMAAGPVRSSAPMGQCILGVQGGGLWAESGKG